MGRCAKTLRTETRLKKRPDRGGLSGSARSFFLNMTRSEERRVGEECCVGGCWGGGGGGF